MVLLCSLAKNNLRNDAKGATTRKASNRNCNGINAEAPRRRDAKRRGRLLFGE
jgi:hypothetical protein